MPVQVCSRCQRVNPEVAAFCYFDGALLGAGGDGAQAAGQLGRDFIFPSGRRCRSFDEFAAGCQEEWVSARDLLRQGVFQQFFGIVGRADLARVAQEAMGQSDSDIGLTTFLGALPVSRTFQPRLDIHPRRLVLGRLLVGETRQVQVALANQGQGQLQGTLKVSEGADWLTIPGQGASCPISTAREQKITLEVNTQKLVALQNYLGKLTVVTNGGVVEVPVGMDLVAQPFGKAPYQGVKTPREMAEKMRTQPKAAVPLLESGEVARWFASNNWNFPVRGHPIKGVAGVQQFFEAMGLSKPPPLQLSQTEVRFRCNGADPVRFQVVLSTQARKWVYALIESDQPWLKVLTPEVSGPQRATIGFEVDSGLLPGVALAEAKLNILANAGQKLPVRVLVESEESLVRSRSSATALQESNRTGSAPALREKAWAGARGSSWLSAMVVMAIFFFLVRLLLVPVADVVARGRSVGEAAGKLNVKVSGEHQLGHLGGWLHLPWSRILQRSEGTLPKELFSTQEDLSLQEFRHYFVKFFIQDFVMWTWWLGPILGVMLVRRRGGGTLDWPWGIIAGAVAGVVGSATLASIYLVLEVVPHILWDSLFTGKGDVTWLILWVMLSLMCWTILGGLVGLVLSLIGFGRRNVVEPVARMMQPVARVFGR